MDSQLRTALRNMGLADARPLVYFVRQAGSKHVKIGKTERLIQRLSQLQTGSPLPLNLVGVIPTNDAEDLEALLHKRLANRLVQGEWFRLTAPGMGALLEDAGLKGRFICMESIRRQKQSSRTRKMRHNQRLSYEELRQEANDAFDASSKTQREIAEELGKSQAVISRALNEAGSGFARTLREIIENLTEYRVEEEVQVAYRTIRKDP